MDFETFDCFVYDLDSDDREAENKSSQTIKDNNILGELSDEQIKDSHSGQFENLFDFKGLGELSLINKNNGNQQNGEEYQYFGASFSDNNSIIGMINRSFKDDK